MAMIGKHISLCHSAGSMPLVTFIKRRLVWTLVTTLIVWNS